MVSIVLAPQLAGATAAVVNADAFYDSSPEEQQAIIDACGPAGGYCFPDVEADVELTTSGVHSWTQGEVEPAHATEYWQGTDPAWGNIAFFNSNMTGPANGLLLLMLPGCDGRPDQYTHFYLRAAALGYHVISVPYWNACGNTWTAGASSAAAATSGCQMVNPNDQGYGETSKTTYSFPYWAGWANKHYINFMGDDTNAPSVDACQTRLERFKVSRDGDDYDALHDGYHFNPPSRYGGDSIAHRVRTWLQFLDANYSTQGWGQFLNGTTVNWNKITVAGHSQGSGLVPQVADTYPVYRAIMISGPQSRVHGPPNGNYTAPTYILDAAAYRANLWSYYGYGDSGHAALIIYLDAVLGLADGSVSAPYIQDSDGFIQTDACSGFGCSSPTLAVLQASGGHKLASTRGDHHTIIANVKGDHRPWSNRPAWDYLLTGKGEAGASCIANAWCTSGQCNTNTRSCE
jgi:hypothetical protein